MASNEKKRVMTGMPVRAARKKFLEIYSRAEPETDFVKKYPKIWPWMETWFRLRARNETLDAAAQAFSEKVKSLHKARHALEQTVHNQRLELAKRYNELEALKRLTQRSESVTNPKES